MPRTSAEERDRRKRDPLWPRTAPRWLREEREQIRSEAFHRGVVAGVELALRVYQEGDDDAA